MGAESLRSRLLRELDNLYEDCNYSSLTFFNAAKSADRWGKSIMFWPAVISAAASFLVALGESKRWSVVSAIASAVIATASFLGASRRADSLKESAKKLTVLRHKVRLETALADKNDDDALEDVVRDLRAEYAAIVSTNELVSDRFFKKSRKQMAGRVLEYSDFVDGAGGGTPARVDS